MWGGFWGITGLGMLVCLLPEAALTEASAWMGIQPHHLQYKLGMGVTSGFFVWLILTTLHLSRASWRSRRH